MNVFKKIGLNGNIIIIFLLLQTGLTSCKKEYESPVFKDIVNIRLGKAKDGIVNMKADAVLHNPNDAKAKLKLVDIVVYIEGKQIATMKKEYDLKIEPLSDFSLPMDVGLNISGLGLVNSILGLLQGRQFDAHYVGKAKIVVSGVPIKVPIDYHDKLKLR